MWGGCQDLPAVHNNEIKQRLTSVIEIFNLPTGKWQQRPTTGNPPLGIWGYASAVVDNEILYFGGYCGHVGCYHNSLNSLCVDSLTWRELSPTNSHGGPMMKAYCDMVTVRFNGEDHLLIVGGWGPSINTPHQHGAQYGIVSGARICTNEHHYYNLSTGK